PARSGGAAGGGADRARAARGHPLHPRRRRTAAPYRAGSGELLDRPGVAAVHGRRLPAARGRHRRPLRRRDDLGVPAGVPGLRVRQGTGFEALSLTWTAADMDSRIRELRERFGWSQGELAERLQVSRQTVNAIETGKYDPSLPLAFKLARLFGEPIEAIFLPDGIHGEK